MGKYGGVFYDGFEERVGFRLIFPDGALATIVLCLKHLAPLSLIFELDDARRSGVSALRNAASGRL
jgi:hypothetical protein